MAKQLTSLTDDQKAAMAPFAQQCIKEALDPNGGDYDRWLRGAKACYGYANIPFPTNVVRVKSPVVAAIAGAIAEAIWKARAEGKNFGNPNIEDARERMAKVLQEHAYLVDDIYLAIAVAIGAVPGEQIDHLINSVIKEIGWHGWIGGQLWPSWRARVSFYVEKCGLELEPDILEKFEAYKAANCMGYWLANYNFVIVSERLTEEHRERIGPNGWSSHRLHCEDGMAIKYPDGWGLWYWHGVKVTEQIVMHPETITIEQIDAEENAEVRRVLIDRYGEARYMEDSKLEPIASDKYGDLFVREFEDDEPLYYIKVTNSTAEPDGSFKTYMLPVNPDHYNGDASRIPHAAIASTWRTGPTGEELLFSDWRDYVLDSET